MSWPTPQDYNEAIQTPQGSFADVELRAGRPEVNRMGLPLPRTGAFASVYRMHCAKNDWAVRFFLQNVTDQQDRYREISKFVMSDDLPYTVSFDYVPEGVRIRNAWYPILKMEWVNGESLDHYIAANCNKRAKLTTLVDRFEEMVTALRAAGIAHGDLQHGNVIMVKEDLRLVDYDGMFVPGLRGKASNELGHRNYQHPGRRAEDFAGFLDHFSAWVIGLSLRCLIEDPSLLRLPGAGDECILFRQCDFLQGPASRLVQALSKHASQRVRQSVEILMALLCYPLNEVPPFSSSLERIDQLPPPSRRLPVASIDVSQSKRPPTPSASAGNWWSDFVVASDGAASGRQGSDAHWLASWKPEFRTNTAQQQASFQPQLAQPTTPGEVYFSQGMAQYDAGNYGQALRYLEHALAQSKTDTHMMCMLGQTYEKLNNFDAALVNYDRALREHPTDEALLFKAACLSQLGRLKESDRLFAHGLSLHPKSVEIGLARAKNRFKMKDYKVVLSLVDAALTSEPGKSECHFWRGLALEALQQFEEARKSFQAAIDNGESTAEVYLHLGLVSEELLETNVALASYEQAVQLKPTLAQAQFRLGFCYYKLSKFDLAHAAFSSGLKVAPDANAWLHDGLALYEMQMYKVAVKAFQNADSLDKKLMADLGARNATKVATANALTLFDSGKYKEAIREIEFLETTGGEVPAVLKLKRAQAHAVLQEWSEAVEAYRFLISTEKRASVYYLELGDCWLQLKKPARALASYKRAERIDITDAEVQLRLGNIYLLCKKSNDAVAHFLMVLNKQPRSVEALVGLGRSRYLAGDLKSASDSLDEALHIEPLNVRALATIAQVLVGLEKYELAVKHATIALNILKLDPDALEARANASLKLGHYVPALADYDLLRTVQPGSSVERERGICLQNLGRHKEAITALTAAIDSAKTDCEAIVALAVSYFATNNFERALEYANLGFSLRPDLPGIALLIADCHRARSDTPLAIEEYSKILEMRFPPLEAYVHRASCYVRLNLADKALADLKQYFRLGGKDPAAHLLIAKLRLGAAPIERVDSHTQGEVIKDLTACLEADPKNVEALALRAEVYASAGPLARALDDCSEWAKLQPNNAQAYLLRGAIMFWLAEHAGAKANFAEARRINPMLEHDSRFAPYYDLCATECEAVKNWVGLIESLRRAIRLVPNDHQRRYRLAAALLSHGDASESLEQLDLIIDGLTGVHYRSVIPFFSKVLSCNDISLKLVDMEVAARLARSSIKIEQNSLDEAMADAKKAVSIDDSNPMGWLLIAFVHRARKHYRLALLSCTQVLALDVNNTTALEIAAGSCCQLNEPHTAATCAEQLVKLKPHSFEAHRLAGYCLLKAQRYYEAQIHFRDALRIQANDDQSFAGHGLAWLGLRKRREAERAFNEALAANKSCVQAHVGLARILFDKKKYKECIDLVGIALKIDSDYLDAYELRAAAYNKMRRFDDAAHDFRKIQDLQDLAETVEEGLAVGRLL